MVSGVTGPVSTSISDPPTCRAPAGDFNHVWVTITLVRAHISGTADPSASGWVTLVDLTNNPRQIDLLDTSATSCILSMLGTVNALPAGMYQQIRLILLSNNPPGGTPTPSPNNCASVNAFNCLELANGTKKRILLSSEANTGIKIPPGRIAGGALNLEAGQTADINIDFMTCNSLVLQGNGEYRLKPTLHAGEVSVATEVISGKVVDSITNLPIPNATIFVFAELPGSDGIDRVIQAGTADPTTGNFSLCPLPMLPSGVTGYDIVAAAISGAGVTYNATITFNVPLGTAMGNIPLVPETGFSTNPGQITGLVTTSATGGVATGADIALSPLQSATPSGGSARLVTIPAFGDSTTEITTETGFSCPAGTKCKTYMLFVPASNPQVGTFSSGGTVYTPPAMGDVRYSLNARAFIPGSGSAEPDNCSPSSLTTDKQLDGVTLLVVTPGGTVTAQTLNFTGCMTGF